MKEIWGISGANGFIGKHLVSKVEGLGHTVEKISRSGFVPYHLDRIVDLASYGNMYDQTDAIEIYQANLIRVIDILNQAKNVKSIVLTSTSSVELPYQTFYSASKKAMEDIAQIYHLEKHLPIKIIRPLSVYGIGEQQEHLIPKLIDSCLKGTEMPFVGEPVHDFIYVDDFVNTIINLNQPPLDKLVGGIDKIGSGKLVSNEEIKEIVEDMTGKKANIKRVDSMREYDTYNWPIGENHSTISLEEGIRRMVYGER